MKREIRIPRPPRSPFLRLKHPLRDREFPDTTRELACITINEGDVRGIVHCGRCDTIKRQFHGSIEDFKKIRASWLEDESFCYDCEVWSKFLTIQIPLNQEQLFDPITHELLFFKKRS